MSTEVQFLNFQNWSLLYTQQLIMFSQCWVSCQISEKVLQEHLNFGLFVFDLFFRLVGLRFTIFSVRFYIIFQLASGRIENRPERVTLVTGSRIEL